jgi:hypothetical protein
MSALYIAMYAGVAAVIIATMVDAIRSVTSRPTWAKSSTGFVERRKQNLPYVGVERRQAERADETSVLVEQVEKAA